MTPRASDPRYGASKGRLPLVSVESVPHRRPRSPRRPPQDLHWPAPSWLDPIKAVEHYFAFLQTLLDANQRLAISMVTTVVSLPHRAKNWL